MKKLNLADFKLKVASDSKKQNLLDQLAGDTQADCHCELICCIRNEGPGGLA